MKELTFVLEDDNLYNAVEAASAKTGHSIQEIIAEALEQWLADIESDQDETKKIEKARKEWQDDGGVEAHEFFRA